MADGGGAIERAERARVDERLGEYGARIDGLERQQKRFDETMQSMTHTLSRIEAKISHAPAANHELAQAALALMRVADVLQQGSKPDLVAQTVREFAAAAPKHAGTNWLAAVGLLAIGVGVGAIGVFFGR